MKKNLVILLVLVWGAVANASIAGLVFTTEGNTLGVSCYMPGFVMCHGKIDTEFDLDWSGVTPGPPYEPIPGVIIPVDVIIGPEPGEFSAYTSTIFAPIGPIEIFTGVALPDGWYFTHFSTEGAVAIDLVVYEFNMNGPYPSGGLMDTIYAVPEPMTLSLLVVGGIAILSRKNG